MKDTISKLQAARDRLMPKVTACWGDAFDGDFDSMLEAINEMKRYHANIDADRAEFRQLTEQRAELLEALREVAAALDWHAHGSCRGFNKGAILASEEACQLARKAIANATGGEG